MTLPLLFAGRYELQAKLGGGAQGEVYRAYDRTEQDLVAVKLLGAATNPLGPWAEAVILRHLTDHHILPIRNADVHLGQAYLATALAPHGSLDAQIIAADPCGLTTEDTVRWVRQACYGVARGHDSGIVHNDVKPANLFLNTNHECVVADWGFAGKLGASGQAPVPGATVQTVAPEIAAAWGPAAIATVRSDVYSLGATAYWMIAGRSPHDFTGIPDLAAKMQLVATTAPPRLRDVAPHVPKWVRDRVEKAMARDPAARYSSAHAFASDLGNRPTVARRWVRTDEHTGHLMCWRGVPDGTGSTYLTCLTAGSTVAGRVITTVTAGTGRRVTRGCVTATRGSWPRVLGQVITALG